MRYSALAVYLRTSVHDPGTRLLFFEFGLQHLTHCITGGFYDILTTSAYSILPSIAGGIKVFIDLENILDHKVKICGYPKFKFSGRIYARLVQPP